MEHATIIGIDLAKRSFQLHGAREDGSVFSVNYFCRLRTTIFAGSARRGSRSTTVGGSRHSGPREPARGSRRRGDSGGKRPAPPTPTATGGTAVRIRRALSESSRSPWSGRRRLPSTSTSSRGRASPDSDAEAGARGAPVVDPVWPGRRARRDASVSFCFGMASCDAARPVDPAAGAARG